MARLLPLTPKNREVLRLVSTCCRPAAHHTTLDAMERHGLIHYVILEGYYLTQKGWEELGENHETS